MTVARIPQLADQPEDRSGSYEATYRRSLQQREELWAKAAADIDWIEPWERVLDDSRAPWLPAAA